MGTDDNGYELAVCHQPGTRVSTDSSPVLGIPIPRFWGYLSLDFGDTYPSILGIPMRIPMPDIVPGARQVIASRASIHLRHGNLKPAGIPAKARPVARHLRS
jgi:hypothetical protein